MKTIKDLKEAIKDFDDALEVELEGCDCIGDWNGKISVDGISVLLNR